MRSQDQADPFGVRLVIEAEGKTWVRDLDLPFAPFPGMGVRIGAYEVLNVVTVLVDDPDGAVTCVVVDDDGGEFTAKKCASLGFVECGPPGERAVRAAFPVRVSVITFASDRQWSKVCTLPFAPFEGLRVRMNGEKVLKIFTVVAGADHRSEVECYAGFEGEGADTVTGDECEALGLERDYR
ncbi:hypothetical protein BX265_6470 [Streptomyces sp. TLI_235]|nr:hypothetical protein [Streptomyces sp. TLI_235]PBC71857.1 hypothetical protein BX265_6470 [Streptomyces sp. TLI_235]